jgi:hypothetical protein
MKTRIGIAAVLAALIVSAGSPPPAARAHCDGLDGPVVGAARRALDAGDVRPALAWVGAGEEAEVRRAFERTRVVRNLGSEARALADTWFFETLVRLHRAGEGAPYVGLAPAGRDLGPAIPAADRALETGSVVALEELLAGELSAGLRARHARAIAAKPRGELDPKAGRRFVRAYVDFVHYVERLHVAATTDAHGHVPEEEVPALHGRGEAPGGGQR